MPIICFPETSFSFESKVGGEYRGTPTLRTLLETEFPFDRLGHVLKYFTPEPLKQGPLAIQSIFKSVQVLYLLDSEKGSRPTMSKRGVLKGWRRKVSTSKQKLPYIKIFNLQETLVSNIVVHWFQSVMSMAAQYVSARGQFC